MTGKPSVAELAAATPASRERYVDFLRAASILVVMLGHWLMAVVTLDGSTIRTGNLIGQVRGLWMGTWLLQVMPIFFFVGGFSSFVALDALERRGGTYAEFAFSRVRRLLRPVAVLLAIWLPVVVIVQTLGLVSPSSLARSTVVVSQPLWFIGVYLIVIALAMPMRYVHQRWGIRCPAALAAGAVAVDVLRFGVVVPYIGFLNVALVWLFAHQLGLFYADGSLRRLTRPVLVAAALMGLGTLIVLTNVGSYPRSMVGLPHETISNMNPPTVCLLALTVWQVALVMLARDRVTAWLARPRVWAVVVGINGVIMTTFLWHLTALLIAVTVLYPLGFPQPPVATAWWWLLRFPWIAILAGLTAGLVGIFGRFERPQPSVADTVRGNATGMSALGMALTVVGVCGFAVSGLVDFIPPNGRRLIVMPISPMIDLLCLLAGVALVRSAVRVSGVTALSRETAG